MAEQAHKGLGGAGEAPQTQVTRNTSPPHGGTALGSQKAISRAIERIFAFARGASAGPSPRLRDPKTPRVWVWQTDNHPPFLVRNW